MRDIATKTDGVSTLSAGDYNANENELENIVTSSDQTLDPAGGADTDLFMLSKAAAGYGGASWAYTDSGVANAYVCSIASNLKPITKYFDNLMIAFKPGNDNTGASTVNVNSLGVKSIKIKGLDPTSGQIKSDRILVLKYSVSLGYFEAVAGFVDKEVVIQRVRTVTGAVATGTTTIPNDDTIPQNTEGDEYMTLAITPTKSSNKLQIDVIFNGSSSNTDGRIVIALFQDSTADALAVTWGAKNGAANAISQSKLRHVMTAGTTSSTTFKIRAGTFSAGTTTFNGTAGSRLYGGVLSSFIEITEVQQ